MKSVGYLIFCLLIATAVSLQAQEPVVISAETPLYPSLVAHIRVLGTVRLAVTTDGNSVVAVKVSGGHKLLQEAAERNVRTWKFAPHQPTSFEVEFVYRLVKPEIDGNANSSVMLNFPRRVEITTREPKVEMEVSR